MSLWLIFWSFAFVAYLFALFAIIGDLFRDQKLHGWWKAVWIIFLIFVPFITALIYVIARGRTWRSARPRRSQQSQKATRRVHPHGGLVVEPDGRDREGQGAARLAARSPRPSSTPSRRRRSPRTPPESRMPGLMVGHSAVNGQWTRPGRGRLRRPRWRRPSGGSAPAR